LLEDAPFAITNAATAKTKPKADLLSSEKSPAAHVRRLLLGPLVAASGTSSGIPAAGDSRRPLQVVPGSNHYSSPCKLRRASPGM
jgi:hypothetical protein